jgi:hypothetical protein
MKQGFIRLAAPVAAALLLLASISPAQADTIAYIGFESGAFGTIDLTTGAVDLVTSSIGITPAGLGEVGNTLYAATFDSSPTLYTVNPTTGALTLVGTSAGSFGYHDFGSTLTGLYGDDFSSPTNLYSVNPSTGAATDVGSTGLTSTQTSFRTLSSNSSTLYLTKDFGLYTLNPANGASTFIGSFGSNVVMTALMMDNGLLYGADESGNFYTINTTTGAATLDTSIASVGSPVWGLAPAAPVPLPATAWLLLSALGGLGVLARRAALPA